MSKKNHTIVDGESMRPIAKKYNFFDWRTIYDHPDNATFRSNYPNNQIVPKPVVVIPDKTFKEVSASTGQKHTFQVPTRRGIWNLKWDPAEVTLGKQDSTKLAGDTDLPDGTNVVFAMIKSGEGIDPPVISGKVAGGKISATWSLKNPPPPAQKTMYKADAKPPPPTAFKSYDSDSTNTCNVADLKIHPQELKRVWKIHWEPPRVTVAVDELSVLVAETDLLDGEEGQFELSGLPSGKKPILKGKAQGGGGEIRMDWKVLDDDYPEKSGKKIKDEGTDKLQYMLKATAHNKPAAVECNTADLEVLRLLPTEVRFEMHCSHRSFAVDTYCDVIARAGLFPNQEHNHKDTLHVDAPFLPPGGKIRWRINCNITKFKSEAEGRQIAFDTDLWQLDNQFWLPATKGREYEVFANEFTGGPKRIMVNAFPANHAKVTIEQKRGYPNLTHTADTFPKLAKTNFTKPIDDQKHQLGQSFDNLITNYFTVDPMALKKALKVFPELRLDGEMGWQEYTDHRCYFAHSVDLSMAMFEPSFKLPYKAAFLPYPLKKVCADMKLGCLEVEMKGSLGLTGKWERQSPDGLTAEVIVTENHIPLSVSVVPSRLKKGASISLSGDYGLWLSAEAVPGEHAGYTYRLHFSGELIATVKSAQGGAESVSFKLFRDEHLTGPLGGPQTVKFFE